MSRSKPRTGPRLGCLLPAGAALLVGSTVAGLLGLASWQVRSIESSPHVLAATVRDAGTSRVLQLDAAMASVVLLPAPAGETLRARADYDPRFHRLELKETEAGLVLRFEPTGSRALALLRMKLGAEPPRLRIDLPTDLPVEIEGRLRGSFAAMEFGGTELRSLDLDLDGAAATVSFSQPLSRPLDTLRLEGNKGSVEVTGLGNASPARAHLRQRLGELDLDLRGAWSRDSQIDIDASLAGGSLWLPASGVVVEGLDDRPVPSRGDSEGASLPHLTLSLSRRAGRLIVVD